jgi:hypothetical protein
MSAKDENILMTLLEPQGFNYCSKLTVIAPKISAGSAHRQAKC